MNNIRTKKECKNINDEIVGHDVKTHPQKESVQLPLRKDTNRLKLLELKVVLQRDLYIDAMKTSTCDFITVEYENDKKKDDCSNTRQECKRIISEPSKSNIIHSDIEFHGKENFKTKKLKSFVKPKSSAKTNTPKLETQSKIILRRRQNISAPSDKVLKEKLTTIVRKMSKSSINRRKKCLHSLEDSLKGELHKTESKRESLRNSTPAGKSSGRRQRAEKETTKEESIQTREKSTTIGGVEIGGEDDPNKLWCICRQPHNNRFMIMCDYCEDWFHGNCIGVSKQKGRLLEKLEQEWICPNCEKKGRDMYVKFIRYSL